VEFQNGNPGSMPLKPGTHRGPYEILSLIGTGGMGEVYKARDSRLNRVVAIKVLAPHLADRPDVRERFEREARTIASLNHPHICALYDVGEQDGAYFLVMEHVEGETLAEGLAKGPLPVDQVLHYAAELADALDRAHRQGVLHRDIKPGNIMLTRGGCKLLDFGLAKLKEAEVPDIFLSKRHTEPNVLTDQGMILGTLQYMAPEQVEGKIDELDARTDIFAFGAVVYEMATGRKAFDGKSQASIMAAILKEDPPPMSSLQPLTPPTLERVVRKCLAKEPEKRWQTASDLRDNLQWIADESSSPRALQATVSTVAARPLRDRVPWAVAAIAVLGVAAFAIPYFRASPTDAQVIRFPISPPGDPMGEPTQLAVSPDGTRVAFKSREGSGATAMVWVRWLDSPTIRPVPGTEGVTFTTLFWSPDGRFLGFVSRGKLKIVPVSGGPVIALADAHPRAGAWSRDGTILFTPSRLGGLARISSAGGAPSPITTLNLSRGERSHRYPQFLPDGRHFLYFVASDKPETRGMYIGSLDSKETKRILTTDFKAEYAAPGYLLFVQDGKLMAQPFSAERQELSGEPSIVADGIVYSTVTGSAGFSVSERGALAYVSGVLRPRLSWTDRSGKPLGTIWAPDQQVAGPELSPDGKRVAVETADKGDIWVLEMGRTGFRLTSDPAADRLPRWSPDGSRMLFQSDRDGGIFHLYQQPSSGVGNADVLFKDTERKYPYDWSRDGKFVAYVPFGSGERVTADIWVLPLTGDRKPFPFLTSGGYQETQPRISPDGRWMAYVSNESGRDDVYISSFPTAGGKVTVSTSGGVQPRWRADGKELFYLSPDQKLMAVPIDGGSPLNGGTPQALFDIRVVPRGSEEPYSYYQYDVTADGQRFLICALPEGTTIPITVVLNWTAGLRK
jgi:serine/threonine protein kinase/Tol biopolymer transport system component